ncbi:hypothetical protein AVEN_254651-1 [Araneus ventricosus]|uniref:Uncharacterized protein n=1 Tax=Araneus ventricosus TaxID=182803 RepID=A0A4Y2RYW8_ARAVE|nr:hypothetical protein AVEN_254651-1 [Araneus ventricosus]
MGGDQSAGDSLPTSSPKGTYTFEGPSHVDVEYQRRAKDRHFVCQNVERATVQGLIFLYIFELIHVRSLMFAICVRKNALSKESEHTSPY